MLLGRDQEQQALAGLLDDARAGRSGVLALAGDAGIGKSALLAYAEEQAVGMRVLRARGVQSEAQIPFAGLLELVRPALPWIGQIPDPQAEALESGQVQVGQGVVVLAVEGEVLAVLEAASREEHRHVPVVVAAGIPHVAAEQNDRPVEHARPRCGERRPAAAASR